METSSELSNEWLKKIHSAPDKNYEYLNSKQQINQYETYFCVSNVSSMTAFTRLNVIQQNIANVPVIIFI